MPPSAVADSKDIQFPTFVQFHWKAHRNCSFLPTEDCIEAVLRYIVSTEKCAYLRAYFDLDPHAEVLTLAQCYYVELFSGDDDSEPYFFGKLYIPRTVENGAIDRSAEIIKGLSGKSTLIQGSAYVVSATELYYQ